MVEKISPVPPRLKVTDANGNPTPEFRKFLDGWFERIGKELGQLPDSLVSTSALEANAVTNGAVDLPGNVDITNTDSWTTIATVNHTSDGNPITILYSAYYRMDNQGAGAERLFLWGRILRDTTEISSEIIILNVGADSWTVGNFPNLFNDEPGAGSYTYKFQVYTTEDGVSGPFADSDGLAAKTWNQTSRADDVTFRTLEFKR